MFFKGATEMKIILLPHTSSSIQKWTALSYRASSVCIMIPSRMQILSW